MNNLKNRRFWPDCTPLCLAMYMDVHKEVTVPLIYLFRSTEENEYQSLSLNKAKSASVYYHKALNTWKLARPKVTYHPNSYHPAEFHLDEQDSLPSLSRWNEKGKDVKVEIGESQGCPPARTFAIEEDWVLTSLSQKHLDREKGYCEADGVRKKKPISQDSKAGRIHLSWET